MATVEGILMLRIVHKCGKLFNKTKRGCLKMKNERRPLSI